MDWFQTGDVRVIGIVDTDYQRIDLFVIPVEITPAIAELALTMVTDGHDPDIAATGGHRCDVVDRRRVVLLPRGPEGSVDGSGRRTLTPNPPP